MTPTPTPPQRTCPACNNERTIPTQRATITPGPDPDPLLRLVPGVFTTTTTDTPCPLCTPLTTEHDYS